MGEVNRKSQEALVKNLSCDLGTLKKVEPNDAFREKMQDFNLKIKTGNGLSSGANERSKVTQKEQSKDLNGKTLSIANQLKMKMKKEQKPYEGQCKSKKEEKNTSNLKHQFHEDQWDMKNKKETTHNISNAKKSPHPDAQNQKKEHNDSKNPMEPPEKDILEKEVIPKILEELQEKEEKIKKMAEELQSGSSRSQELFVTHLELLIKHMGISYESLETLLSC
jgi:hypothetical protein